MARKKRPSRTSGATAAAEVSRQGKWTATGAARAARDARIATATHLRSAEVAARWEMTKLVASLDVWRQHLRAQAEKERGHVSQEVINATADLLLLGGSGLTPPAPTECRPFPTTPDDAARAILDRRADDLATATLYVVSPSMCDVDVIAAAQTLRRRHRPTRRRPRRPWARLLAERAGVPSDVRVVTLRPTTRTANDASSDARDWHHRWVVRMHKVRQWYATEKRHKVIYRGPHVKGPADKPMLAGEVVRSMTRPTRNDC